MGTTIKGISIEIGGNSYKLDKVLKDSTDASKSLGSELSQVNKQLKFSPDNTVLLTQKQEILSEEIKVTSERLKTLEDIREQIEKKAKNGDLGADQYRAYQREVENTRSKLKYFENQLSDTKKAVDEFETGVNKTDLSKFQAEVKEAQDKATEFKDKVKETAKNVGSDFGKLGAGALAGTTVAVTSFDSVQSALNNIQAQTGLEKSVINSYKEIVDLLYSDNYGEDKADIATAMSAIIQTTKETDPQKLKEYTANLITLRDTFGFDYIESLRSADMLTKQWNITSQEAFNLIVQGAQNGLNKNGDLLDTINEYSVHYKNQGYSAEQFFNSLTNGAEAGTFSVDKLGDAMKEFGIRTKDTAESTTEAYQLIGLDADEMRKKFAKGGETAQIATQETLTALFSLDDQVKQNQAGVGLFGTMWEDLGIDGVKALTNVEGSADSTAGAMNKIKDVKYDDVKNELGTLARTAETKLLNPLIEKHYPKIKEFIEWTGDNLEDLEPIISFIAGASASIFIGKKVSEYGKAIGDLVSAYKAYKTAADVATASQTALNTAQASNIVGIVVTAIGLLTSGIMALSGSLDENEELTYKVTSAQKELYERTDDTTESYKRAREARAETVGEIESEYDYYQKLNEELGKITTKNGKIKKGYETRAEFITSTLSEALGIEIGLTDDQIENYGELKTKLEEVLKLEEQRALISAYESDYNIAKKDIKQNTIDYGKHKQNLNKAQANYNSKQQDLRNAKYEFEQTSIYDVVNYTKKAEAYRTAQIEFGKAEQNLTKAQKKFNKAEKNFTSNKTIIENYETAAEAIVSGNSKKISKAIDNLTNELITADTGTQSTLEKQLSTAKQNYTDINNAFINGLDGITKADVDAAKKFKRQAQKELDKFNEDSKEDIKKSGSKIPESYIIAIKNGVPSVEEAIGLIPEVAIKGLAPDKGKAYMEGGGISKDFIDALNDSLVDVESAASSLPDTAVGALNPDDKLLSPYTEGVNFANGYAKGIEDTAPFVFTTVGNFIKNVIATIKKSQDSHSPARKGYAEGKNLVDGYDNAVTDNSKKSSEKAKKLVKGVLSSMNETQKQFQMQYGGMKINLNGVSSVSGKNTSISATSKSSNPPNVTVQFNNVTVNSGDDINSLAQKVSEQIAKEYVRKEL